MLLLLYQVLDVTGLPPFTLLLFFYNDRGKKDHQGARTTLKMMRSPLLLPFDGAEPIKTHIIRDDADRNRFDIF